MSIPPSTPSSDPGGRAGLWVEFLHFQLQQPPPRSRAQTQGGAGESQRWVSAVLFEHRDWDGCAPARRILGREKERRKDGRMDRRTDGQTDGWTDGRMDRWTDGWTDGWKEGKEECGCLTRAPMGAFGYPWPSSASPDMRCCRCWKGDAGGPGTPGHPRPILTRLGCPEGSPDLAARPRGRRLGPADAAARL